jgi:hypothetical protein
LQFGRYKIPFLSDAFFYVHRVFRQFLKKSKLKPWLKKQWCISQINGEYLAKLEDVLAVYNRPMDPKRPRLCFDERPCQLLDDVVVGFQIEPGKAA